MGQMIADRCLPMGEFPGGLKPVNPARKRDLLHNPLDRLRIPLYTATVVAL